MFYLFFFNKQTKQNNIHNSLYFFLLSVVSGMFVLRFYSPVSPVGHVERSQFT